LNTDEKKNSKLIQKDLKMDMKNLKKDLVIDNKDLNLNPQKNLKLKSKNDLNSPVREIFELGDDFRAEVYLYMLISVYKYM
jgi:hypothetical protein